MMNHYIVEVRNDQGQLDLSKEEQLRTEHPYLFTKPAFTMDELCHYASYGQGRNKPTGPLELGDFMQSIGISYRFKYW